MLFFFLFSLSSEPVSCDVVVVAISTLPRPHTGDIPSAPPRHCNYRTNRGRYNCCHVTLCREPSTRWTCPHTRCRHTQATLPPLPSLCLVHLKKASDKSFPLFSPFVFNGAGHFPSTQARCTPCGTQAPTPPPLVRMQATPSLSLSPQPPPPQCLYDRHHFPNPIAVQPASPDFATQTGGAKGALAPTISSRHIFAHPPPLCRSFHSCGCPHCALQFTRPPRPTPPHPACCPPLHARGHRRDSAPLVPSAWAMPHARGRAMCKGKDCTQGEGPRTRGGGRTRRDAHKGKGCMHGEGEGVQVSGAAHEQKGAHTLSAPPAPSRST